MLLMMMMVVIRIGRGVDVTTIVKRSVIVERRIEKAARRIMVGMKKNQRSKMSPNLKRLRNQI
jgi:hypothetical protein